MALPLLHLVREQSLQALPILNSAEDLLSLDDDCIWTDTQNENYILGLSQATLFPRRCIEAPLLDPGFAAPHRQRIRYHDNANLLVGNGGTLYPDSLFRSAFQSACLTHLGEGLWCLAPPAEPVQLPGTWLYAELFCRHFGHALVDMPARLWPLLAGPDLGWDRLGVIGFGLHHLDDQQDEWQQSHRELLESYGVAMEQVVVANRPVRCERLLVPRRISPFLDSGGRLYNQVMQNAGQRLLGNADRRSEPTQRIFLSRSRLPQGRRSMDPDDALRLDDLFASHGFRVFHPQELPLAEQVAVMQQVSHVAGCVGSQMHLMAFCGRPGLKAFRIAPSSFNTPTDAAIVAGIPGSIRHHVIPSDETAATRHASGSWRLLGRDWLELGDAIALWLA